MRLDIDCIRDILLCVEENTGLRRHCFFVDSGLTSVEEFLTDTVEPRPDYQQPLLDEYGHDTLIYHVHYCLNSGLIEGPQPPDSYRIPIYDLSPKGHELLAKIRDNKQWTQVKHGLTAVRNYSLSAISAGAEGVTSAAISAYFSGQR